MKRKKCSSQWTQFMQFRKEAWKKNSGLQRGLNRWPRGAMLYQLSYEATDEEAHCDDHFFIFKSVFVLWRQFI